MYGFKKLEDENDKILQEQEQNEQKSYVNATDSES